MIGQSVVAPVPVEPPSGNRPLPKPSPRFRPLHRIWRRTIDEIELNRLRLPVRGLPAALEGLVACQISDFHVDRDEDLERLYMAVELINRENPDLVFLTGDYFSGRETMTHYLGPVRKALAMLNPRIGAFAVAGNHDHWSAVERITHAMEQAGVEMLANSSRRVPIGSERLTMVGIDDLWSRRAEPSRAFSEVEPDECTVVLAHNPDTALYAHHLKPGVMLSGHTHGGVVRIPRYGSPLRSILRIGKEFYSGLNPYGDFHIYTNRGLGTFMVRVRINCRPEVSCFTLTALADADAHTHSADHEPERLASEPPARNHPPRRPRRSKRAHP